MTRTLFVTGASRGLGRHIAERALAADYRVVGLSRSTDYDAAFETVACDVSDAAAVQEVFRQYRRDDSVFALINAAGIASMNLVLTTPPETARRIFETNALGTIYACQAMGRLLARRRQGRIINFSTIAVSLALKGEAVYAASKAAVESFSRCYAREMADHGVTVNCVAPGPIDTALIAGVPKDKIQDIVDQQIIQRQAEPDHVWDLVSLLLQDEAAMITGEVLHVGGV